MEATLEEDYRRLTTPRAAAIAGILFAILYGASLVLIRAGRSYSGKRLVAT
jgi:hypothetical protein